MRHISEERRADILVVEDNPGDIVLIREAFQEWCAPPNLHIARDGVQALDFLARKGSFAHAVRPDIILLDLNLPRRSGLEVLQWVKSDDDLKDIPVIVLTSSGADMDVSLCSQYHADAYLTKPPQVRPFFELVKTIEPFWIDRIHLLKK